MKPITKEEALKGAVKTKIEVVFVPWHSVEPNEFNPNVMEDDIAEETKKLMSKTNAQDFFSHDPLRVSPWDVFYSSRIAPPNNPNHAPFVLIDGQHRWEFAAKDLKWEIIGLDIVEMTEAQARQLAYSKSYLRGHIDPIKEAKLFAKELEQGLTQEQVAEKYFKTPGYISASLSLLTLPGDVLELAYTKKPNLMPLTKGHLLALVGLPAKEIREFAKVATENGYQVKSLAERTTERKEKIAYEEKKKEARTHYALTTCPICGSEGDLNRDLSKMECPKNNMHSYELKIRSTDSIAWGPLDTKETMLKKKILMDSGAKMTIEEAIKKKGKIGRGAGGKGSPIVRKLDWIKHAKKVEEIMPCIQVAAFNFLTAHKEEIVMDSMIIHATNKETYDKLSPSTRNYNHDFEINTSERGLSVTWGKKNIRIDFESKDWKRGADKTRVNIRGADTDEQLKAVRSWLDKVIAGEAKIEDFPFDVFEKREKERMKKIMEEPTTTEEESPEEEEEEEETGEDEED